MDIQDLMPVPVSHKRADVKEKSPAGIEWEIKLKNMEEVKRVAKKCDMGSGVKETKEVAAGRKIEMYRPGWYIGSCAKMEARRGRRSRSRIKRYSPYEWKGRNGNRRRSSRSSSRSRRWSCRNRKSTSRSSSRTRRSSRSSSRNRGMSSRNRRETRSRSWNSESRNRRRNTRSRSRSPNNSRNWVHRGRNNINRERNSRSKSRSWGRNSRNRSTSRDRNKRRNSRSRNGIRRNRCRRSRSSSFRRSNSRSRSRSFRRSNSRSRNSRSRSRNSISREKNEGSDISLSREKNEGSDISLSRKRINGSIESNRINSRSSKTSSLERNEGISRSSSSSSSSASLDIGIRKIEPGDTQSYREEEKRREWEKGESCDTKACSKRNLELMEGRDVNGKVLEEELGVMMEGCDGAQGCDKAGVAVLEEGLEIKMGREGVERKELDVKEERNDRIMYDKKMPKEMEVEMNSSMNIFSKEKESVEESRYQRDERFIPLQEISSGEDDLMKQICDIRSFSPLKFVEVKQKRGCELNNDWEEKNINEVTIGRKGATAKDKGDKKYSQENRIVGSGVEKKMESVAEKERMSHCLKEESKLNRNVEKDGWDIEREYARNIDGEYTRNIDGEYTRNMEREDNMDIKSYNARNREREFTRDIEREDTLFIERDNNRHKAREGTRDDTRYKEREGTRDDTRYKEREGTRDTLYKDRKEDMNYIRFREREGTRDSTRYKYREENNDYFKYKGREGSRDDIRYKYRKDAKDNSRYTEREDTRDDIKYKESKRTVDKEFIFNMDKERNERGGGRVASRIKNRTLTDGELLNEEKAERREKLGGTFGRNTRPQNWFREEERTTTTKIENYSHTTEENHPSTTKENHTITTIKGPTSMPKEENQTIEKCSSNDAKELRLEKPLAPLSTLSRSPYLPPARLKMSRISDKSSAAFQRRSWEALKKHITGLLNKVNTSNLSVVLGELFRKNVIRGRGLVCQALLRAQSLHPTSSSTHVLAALVAGINSKFPQIGELLLHRLLLQIRRGDSCFAPCRFLAHLVNQRVAHEMVAMETIKLLLENVKRNLERGESWRESVEMALAFLKECGSKLREVAPNGLVVVMATLRNILQNNSRFKYVLEDLMKEDFKDFPSLLREEDQLTHLVEVEGDLLEEENLNEFKEDLDYLENEAKYKQLRASVLGQNGEDSGSEADTEDSDFEDQNAKEVKEDQMDIVSEEYQKDLVTKEDRKGIVTKEDWMDIVSEEYQKDLVTKEYQMDIVIKGDQKDIMTKEDQKDVVSMEDLVSKKVKEDQKDLVAEAAQKDVVSEGDHTANEDQDDVAAKKGQMAVETKESQEEEKDVEAQVAKEDPRVAPPPSDLPLDHTSLKSFRRSAYLTMQQCSSDAAECVLRLKEEVRAGLEGELCHLILDCCAQQRDLVRFYCLLAENFCRGSRHYQKPFEAIFSDAFDTCHRLQTEELLNVAKFFSHLLSCDVISWRVLAGLRLGHASTTRSSQLFVRVLFEELTAALGLSELRDRLRQPPSFPALESLLPREDSAPFFASVARGDMVRSGQPKPTAVVAPVSFARKDSSGSSTSSGSSSSSSSSSSSTSSSSSSTSTSSDSSDDERPSKKMRPSCEASSSSSSGSSSSSSSSSSDSSSSDSSSSDESSSDKSDEKGSCKNSEAGGARTAIIAAGSCKRKKLSSRRVRDDLGKDPPKALSPFAQKKGGEERAGLVPSVQLLEGE